MKESVNLKIKQQDFPGGPVVENPPSNEGDVDPWSRQIPYAIKQLSLWTATTEAHAPNKRANICVIRVLEGEKKGVVEKKS